MNLKCKIHGKEFPAVQGVTFSEEYNETLDSGSLIITHVSKIKKLKPYEDVFVYDNEFNGFGEKLNPRDHNKFYKHMLVQNFTEEILNLKDKIYKYKISLMSEIKALEKVQLPNISVTQPLKSEYKVSVYDYLVRFVNLYSPKYKVVSDSINKRWVYKSKYTVDPALKEIFGDVYSPDFTLNLPTLRDLLSKLMIVKDMIPYVEDNVIKAMDITARKKEFVLDEKHMNYITGTMNSEDYCTGLRRTYSDALSQDSTCRSVENIGFRNSNESLMTLGNMRLETRFPIYKINKVLMCYFKQSSIEKKEEDGENQKYLFLCKQDITKLVKLNTKRNILSQDWEDFKNYPPISIEELSQYKISTLGYDIGSKYIEGWGTSYSYPMGWWLPEKNTYLENILYTIDTINENGIYQYDKLFKSLPDQNPDNYIIDESKNVFQTIKTGFTTRLESQESFVSAIDMKGLFFIVDYQGFYNGSIITSKDNVEDEDIIANDNSSSSLALLELDGLSQKEKANRFGNKTIQISARYEDISQMQELGDVYNNEDDTDVIIYHREYSIYDNMINCIYFGVKDYVLKNYYTSVFARHRTWNLIPYSESITRAENKKYNLIFSKKDCYYENIESFKLMPISKLLSSFAESGEITTYDFYESLDKINYGYISHNGNFFATDVNLFLHGYSLCFNLKTFDNISMGNYISKPSPFTGKIYDGEKWENHSREWLINEKNDDYTGSKQNWYSIVDSEETGYTEKLGFYLGHYEEKSGWYSQLVPMFKYESILGPGFKDLIDKIYNERLFVLPKITQEDISSITNHIGGEIEIYKDNKEQIDMTYQIEPISLEEDVMFSPWIMKLSELLSNYYKITSDKTYHFNNYEFFPGYKTNTEFKIGYIQNSSFALKSYPKILCSMPFPIYSKLKKWITTYSPINLILEEGNILDYSYRGNVEIEDVVNSFNEYNVILSVVWQPISVVDVYFKGEEEYLTIKVKQTLTLKSKNSNSKTEYKDTYEIIELKRVYSYLGESLSDQMAFFEYFQPIFTVTNGEEKLTFDYTDLETIINIACEEQFDVTSDSYYSEDWKDISGIISPTINIEKIYHKNMFLLLNSEKLKSTLVYDEYLKENLPKTYIISEEKVTNIFKINENYNYITVDLLKLKNSGYNLEEINSIQYWYKDIKDEITDEKDKNLMKFVFGVNISDQDKENGYVKIYTSLISNRNPNVYDENYNIIGKVHNYLDEDDLKPYGLDQYYDEESVD